MTETQDIVPIETVVVRTYTRPNIISLIEFQGADIFGTDDAEHLAHDNPEEALEQMLEDCGLAWCGDVKKYLDTMTLFTSVAAYKRVTVDDFHRKAWPEGLVESLRESYGEEHGAQDGDDRLSDEDLNQLHARMKDITEWYISRTTVYPCEKIRSWSFDNADLRELVAQLKPEWLDPALHLVKEKP